MAQPTNTYDSYDMVGIREDLSNVIYNVDPTETPFLSRCKKVSAKNAFHEWQTDSLRAPTATNAHIEGDDTTATARTPTVRLGNYAQIFKDAVTVPDSDDGLDKAGRASEMGYQVMKTAKELKLDIDTQLWHNTARVAGTSSTARYLAGVPTWLTSNTSDGAGATAPTGDGSDARSAGTGRAFTEGLLQTVLQSIWNEGGKPDTAYLNASQMNVAAGFVGRASAIDQAKAGQVDNYVDVYKTNWGTVTFEPTRHIAATDVAILQSDMWAVAQRRPMKNVPLAKTGDNSKRQVVCELTLEARNEKANGAVFDLT